VYKSLPALCQSLGACLSASDAVLDGEIVYLGPDGKPQFQDLMRRRSPQYFYSFDLLWLNGRDHRGLPLWSASDGCGRSYRPAPSPLLYVDHVVGTGVDLFEAVRRNDLEGIVAKRADGRYTPEERTWVFPRILATVSTLPEAGQPEDRATSPLPPPTHLRYCMKSVALDFVPQPAK